MTVMTPRIRPWLAGAAAMLACAASFAGIQASAAPPALPAAYAGTWHDPAGGMIAVQAAGTALEVWGTDRASIYRTVCIADAQDNTMATCTGEGYNHLERLRFNYRSRFKLDTCANEGAGQITEEWEAHLATGIVRGRVVFKRQPPAASR